MEEQKVIISENLAQSLPAAMAECPHDRLFVLCDETTRQLCLPIVEAILSAQQAEFTPITIGATDTNKTLESLAHVWSALQQGGATRHSLLLNVGGGMVTDLGGFAASTFKRGIHYINIPTTLLSMVDASVGGKTGINFGGLKNEVGVFRNADCVILDTVFLRTMDRANILSGYAEMLKHGLISNETMWAELVNYDISRYEVRGARCENNTRCEARPLQSMLADSVAVKQRIVLADPTEQGLRKALNLGHTAGHAFESFAMRRQPVLHGYAVAWGLIVELYLSVVKTGFPTDRMRQTVNFIRENYGQLAITCRDYPELLELMHHDKKNTGDTINFTLLGGIGDLRINQTATEEEIKEALDFYREG